jgi:hypothetical protein
MRLIMGLGLLGAAATQPPRCCWRWARLHTDRAPASGGTLAWLAGTEGPILASGPRRGALDGGPYLRGLLAQQALLFAGDYFTARAATGP